ncbi:MAG: hypothetical protein R2843_11180 [Thermomicrobiales bacterium]
MHAERKPAICGKSRGDHAYHLLTSGQSDDPKLLRGVIACLWIERSVEENETALTAHRRSLMGWSAAAFAGIGLAGALKPSLARAVDSTPEAMSDVEWGEFDAMLAAVAPNVSMLAAELMDGAVSPIHSVSLISCNR